MTAVITGNVGPKAFATLQAGNVKIYAKASGTVKEAIEKFKAGQLEPADQGNVSGREHVQTKNKEIRYSTR
jgi:predicted Fe-Mo cluster-binding NifX family protein